MRTKPGLFLICPKCLSAFSGETQQSKYDCPVCRHEWQAPLEELNSAYFTSVNCIDVSLSCRGSEDFLITTFPAEIGRNSDFKALQNNLAVSRKHCRIELNDTHEQFLLFPYQNSGGTYLNGRQLIPETPVTITTGDEIVLSGVVLRLKCALKKNIGKFPYKQPKKQLVLRSNSFVYIDCHGTEEPIVSDKLSDSTICVGWKHHDTGEWHLLSIDKSQLCIDGESFIERGLAGSENISINNYSYVFNADNSTFEPEKPELGQEINISELKAGYGNNVILDKISCHIPGGSLTAILGQSGCGKTTLIKVLSGHKHPMDGSIDVSGMDDVSDYPHWAQKHLALVPQHDIVHAELTVRQCIKYAADIRSKDNIKNKNALVDRIIHEMGLDDFSDSLISNLSGGQRKRVNIATELVGRPDVLLLDEPTTGLDYATENQIIATLRQLSRQGKTIVFVTHSLATLEAADHVIVIRRSKQGARVLAEGKPQDVQRSIGVETWEELYSRIDALKSKEAMSVAKGSVFRLPYVSALFNRYLATWMNAPFVSTFLLFGLPILLGVMIRAAVSIDAPLGMDRLLFGLIAMFWLGINQTVREIVKEKTIFVQERMNHIGSWSYLLSKLLFYLLLTFPQAFLMSVPIMCLNLNSEGYYIVFNQLTCPFSLMLPMMWVAGFIGSIFGLFLSSISMCIKKGEVSAVLLSVIVTLPQILFSAKVLPQGIAKPLVPKHFYTFSFWHENAPLAEVLSYGTFSRYLYLPLDAVSTEQTSSIIFKAFVFNGGILAITAMVMVVLTWFTLEMYSVAISMK